MDLLRFGASGLRWLRQSLRSAPNTISSEAKPGEAWGETWASLLCDRPTIIGSWPSIGFPLGIASAIGPWLSNHPIEFLIMPSWAWELPDTHGPILTAAAGHVREHPRHRLSFLCNTPAQEPHFAEAGWPAVTFNTNMFMNESTFRPLPDVKPIYDAIYNARLVPDKRPELAAGIERLCFIYFHSTFDSSVSDFHAEHARLRAIMPSATFVNRLTPEGCEQLDPARVNLVLNQSRVGLCLSAIEGQMRASIEYMMAGLPIVSTPSIGGRDYFYDDEYCAVVPADPRQLREAVGAMIARNIPRDYIRAKTMSRVERDRARFVAFVQAIIDRRGGSTDFSAHFSTLLRANGLKPWTKVSDFTKTLESALQPGHRTAD
ncbi:MAG: glycosyltransferase [Alphaproteobacteria bacterium]